MNGLARRAAAVAPLRAWLLVAGVYAVGLVVVLRRLRQFGPDSRFYLAWAYHYGGLSERDAGKRTYEFLNSFSWFQPFCYGACDTTDPTVTYSWLFHGFSGGLVAPRILYPLLSAPFVRLFGPKGMLVVPVVSYALCIALVMVLASRLFGQWWAVLAGVSMVLPITVSRWSSYAYTEALTMLLCTACVIVLPLRRRTGPRDLALFGMFLLLFAFTRQFHLILVAGAGLVWLIQAVSTRRLRNEWLPFLLVAVVLSAAASIVHSLMAPGYSIPDWFYARSGADSIGEIPAGLARVTERVVKAELWNLTADLPLLVICLVAAAGLLIGIRSQLSQLTLGLLLGTFILHLLNAEPSDFRYYAIVFPLFTVIAAGTMARLVGGPADGAPAAPAGTAATESGSSGMRTLAPGSFFVDVRVSQPTNIAGRSLKIFLAGGSGAVGRQGASASTCSTGNWCGKAHRCRLRTPWIHQLTLRCRLRGQRPAFLDAVERTIVAMTDEVASLRAQLGRGAPPSAASNTSGGPEGAVFAELEQIKTRLAWLEAAIAGGDTRFPTGDPVFGNRR